LVVILLLFELEKQKKGTVAVCRLVCRVGGWLRRFNVFAVW